MKYRYCCICNWKECSVFMDMYESYGHELQKGMFKLRKGTTAKNEEYRKLIFNIFGFNNDTNKQTFIANYHWDINLLSHLNRSNKQRTSLLTKEEAKLLNITDKALSFNREGKKFFSLPTIPKSYIKIEIESFTSFRSNRLKRKSQEITSTKEAQEKKQKKSNDVENEENNSNLHLLVNVLNSNLDETSTNSFQATNKQIDESSNYNRTDLNTNLDDAKLLLSFQNSNKSLEQSNLPIHDQYNNSREKSYQIGPIKILQQRNQSYPKLKEQSIRDQ